MLTNFISYVPAIIGLLSIAVFVFLNGTGVRNKTFTLFNLTVAAWLAFLLFADTSKEGSASLWLLRFALFFGQLMFTAFYCFALTFPYQSKIRLKHQAALMAPNVLTALLLLTPLGIGAVGVANYGAKPENAGVLYTLSDVLGALYLLAGIGIILYKYRRADDKQKKQTKVVLFGVAIAAIADLVTVEVLPLLHISTQYVDFNGFSLFIFSLFVVYAMFRHGFLDIRFIVARTMGYVLSLGTIAGIYSLFLFGILTRFTNSDQLTTGAQLLYVFMAIFLAVTFQPLKRFFDRITNRLFYQDAYDAQEIYGQLNKVLVSSLDVKYLMMQSISIIQTALKPGFVTVSLHDGSENHRVFASRKHTVTPEDGAIIRSATPHIHHKVIIPDHLDNPKQVEFKEALQRNDIAVLVRLTQNVRNGDAGFGYLVLGGKKSGNPYTAQDVRVLDTVANELIIAIQNALHYEEIQQFNLVLQSRVDDATRQLRRTNDKLRALDETKDDFISMASHQLRTPLTSIKGYLSMVLEGDAGKVNDTQKKMLGQAFVSSQRMVYLIADLLNVSRLKTGKFVIEATPTNLADVVSEEIDQLVETAAARDLKLTYEKPKDFPTLDLDQTKTRQVIMNFVDNAIYYTPAGGHIQVELEETPTSIELKVVDDGIGVPKAEQHHLFTKFYRAGNAQKARPDGTGLGLFMAKKVILAQGGSIIFESHEGKGSIFGFLFPKNHQKPSKTLPALEVAEEPAVSQK